MKVVFDGVEYILLTQCPLLDTTEQYAFKTDVHKSYDGSDEVRIPEIDAARQSMTYSLSAYRAEIVGLFNDVYSWMRKTYLVPQPLESLDVGDISGTSIIADTSKIPVDIDSLILIQPSSGPIAIRKIVGVSDDGYVINSSIIATDASIYPLRKCIIDGNVSNTVNNSTFNPMLNLRVIDNVKYPVADAPEQYKDNDLYFMPLLLDGDFLDIELQQHQSIVDGQIGKFWSFTNWDNPIEAKNLRIIMRSRQEYLDLKKWFYRRRGMLNSFWLPTYQQSFNIVSASSSVLRVRDDNFIDGKKNIAIKSNGNWSAYEIVSTDIVGSDIELLLSPPPPSNISRASYLNLYRLASDSIEFRFLGNDIIETTLPIVELNK